MTGLDQRRPSAVAARYLVSAVHWRSQRADGRVSQRRDRFSPREPVQHGNVDRLPRLQGGRHAPCLAAVGRARGEGGIRAVGLTVGAPAPGTPY
jgi:hypothetical protein